MSLEQTTCVASFPLTYFRVYSRWLFIISSSSLGVMQPKGEAPKKSELGHLIESTGCFFFCEIHCACDSLCSYRLHCPHKISQFCPLTKLSFHHISSLEFNCEKEHRVPSLLKLSLGAVKRFKYQKYCLLSLIQQAEFLVTEANHARVWRLRNHTE